MTHLEIAQVLWDAINSDEVGHIVPRARALYAEPGIKSCNNASDLVVEVGGKRFTVTVSEDEAEDPRESALTDDERNPTISLAPPEAMHGYSDQFGGEDYP